jgi:hypothetical protein
VKAPRTWPVALGLALLLILATAGCKRAAPSPWREMKFPVRHGEVLAGSSERQLVVEYKGIAEQAVLLREFRQTLERHSWVYERDGKEHDPPSNTHSLIFKKGAELVVLTVSGRKSTSVRVRKM